MKVHTDLGPLVPGKVDTWPQPPRGQPLARPEPLAARSSSECGLGTRWLPAEIVSLRDSSTKRAVCSLRGEGRGLSTAASTLRPLPPLVYPSEGWEGPSHGWNPLLFLDSIRRNRSSLSSPLPGLSSLANPLATRAHVCARLPQEARSWPSPDPCQARGAEDSSLHPETRFPLASSTEGRQGRTVVGW